MATKENKTITVQAEIEAPLDKVWEFWTAPKHIMNWNNSSEDWHTTKAENDLREGGSFFSRMEAKDGSEGFLFEGKYEEVKEHERIIYKLTDGRKVEVNFESHDNSTRVTEIFEAEEDLSMEMQKKGWQAILDNFKNYVESTHTESNGRFETLEFQINIDAPIERVYQNMLDEEQFKKWTFVFSPGSYYEGSWEKGSKILFLAPGEEGEMKGMESKIKENIPFEFVSIEHQGEIDQGKNRISDKSNWEGAMENYAFSREKGFTVVKVSADVTEEYKDYFIKTWPKALEKLKEICEG